MAINPIQLPSSQFDGNVDWTPLAQLGQNIRTFQKRQTLADLGKQIQNGGLDYNQAAGKLFELGDMKSGLALLQQGQGQKAAADFAKGLSTAFGGGAAPTATVSPAIAPAPSAQPASTDPRGLRNNNPLNIEAGDFTQSQPGYSGSDGRFAKFASLDQGIGAASKLLDTYGSKYGLNTVSGIIGRWAPSAENGAATSNYVASVSKALGVAPDQPIDLSNPETKQKLIGAMAQVENGRPLPQSGPQTNVTATVPTGSPTLGGTPLARAVPTLLAAAVNPNLPKAQQETARELLKSALDDSKLPTEQKNYVLYRAQGGTDDFTTWDRANKKSAASSVTVDQRGENAFESEFGKKQADRWNGMLTDAQSARQQLTDIQNMRDISRRLAADPSSQGAAAGLKEALGPYASALGVDVNGLSDIQAYTSIIQRLAPQQRAVGSGSTSDIEFKGFVKSLPGLSQTPEAREMTLDTMEALNRDKLARGDIASRLATKEITRSQAEIELRKLPDPLAGFREWRKANPDQFSAAMKAGASQPQAKAAPKLNQSEVSESIANARAAIQANPGARDAIIQRLRGAGIDPSGL